MTSKVPTASHNNDAGRISLISLHFDSVKLTWNCVLVKYFFSLRSWALSKPSFDCCPDLSVDYLRWVIFLFFLLWRTNKSTFVSELSSYHLSQQSPTLWLKNGTEFSAPGKKSPIPLSVVSSVSSIEDLKLVLKVSCSKLQGRPNKLTWLKVLDRHSPTLKSVP